MKKLKILALEYKLQWFDGGIMNVAGAHGLCNTCDLRIMIDKSGPLQRQRVTLLHEVMHAINDQLQLQEGGSDEDVSARLSTGLMAFAKANPKVWSWIFSS
jgi:hypothetical protein